MTAVSVALQAHRSTLVLLVLVTVSLAAYGYLYRRSVRPPAVAEVERGDLARLRAGLGGDRD